MNKILLLVLSILAIVLGACSDDDKEDGLRGANGEKLVSKVIFDKDNYITFEYDKDGIIKKVIEYGRWAESGSQEGEHSGSSTKTFTYNHSVDKIIAQYESKEIDDRTGEEETDSETTIYTLNNKGLIVASKDDYETVAYTYNDKNQLIRFTAKNEDYKFIWENSNIIEEKDIVNGESLGNYTYSNNANKALQLNFIYNLSVLNNYLFCYGYFGVTNKNLVSSSNEGESSYEYEFDKDGYVTVMKCYEMENGKKVLDETITIEYK